MRSKIKRIQFAASMGLLATVAFAQEEGPIWTKIDSFEQLEEMMISESSLKDPFSVRFRHTVRTVYEASDSTVWCGHLNAKNSMGGYIGWHRFYISDSPSKSPLIKIETEDDGFSSVFVDTFCKGSGIEHVKEEYPSVEGASLNPGLEGAVLTLKNGRVHVTDVATESPADIRKLRVDDVITVVNRKPVQSLKEFQTISSNSRILFLEVDRGGKRKVVQIRPD